MKKKNNTPRPTFKSTRKVIRKEKRVQKKKRRQEHYLKKKNDTFTSGKFVKRPADDVATVPEVKKKTIVIQPSAQEILMRQSKKVKKETDKLQSQMEKQRKKIFLQANEDEDKIIKKLEKQLGLNKTKNKNNFFADDGLDYLLEICDRTTSEQIVAAEKHLADVDKDSDFEEDLAAVTGKKISKKDKRKEKSKEKTGEVGSDDDEMDEDFKESDLGESNEDEIDDDDKMENSDYDNDIDMDDDDVDDDDDDDDDKSEESDIEVPKKKLKKDSQNEQKLKTKTGKEKIISEEEISKVFSEDEVSHIFGDDNLDGFSEDISIESNKDPETKEKPDVWEDIYGRKRDKEGNIIKEEKGTYVPPHLRNKDSASDKDLAQLKRQIKSVLNKLAGTNLHWACTSIENLYSNNSRNSVNTALTQLWLEGTVGPSVTPDRLVAEHAALVSVLHANIGSEIGAHFLEELCRKFDEMMQTPQPMEDKRLDNLVACLAYLFSFKIYHALLLYDILGRLVQDLTEKNIDCVLTVLRAVGGVLRKEEPASLKTFIQETQAKVTALNESVSSGSRMKFLVEVLLAVKNNNMGKVPGYAPAYQEELRKSARTVLRRGNYVAPLNVRLEDLLRAHERGKWWVVGSAWEGNRTQEDKTVQPSSGPSADQKLLELARKMRMNTDIRRSIFCIIMSAEDYMDAFSKLQHLGMRRAADVAPVLLACCLAERAHNPYYAVLAQKLCDTDRTYQLSIQYTVWDKIKELENMSKQALSNLAQFLTHLIMEKGLPLSVLKIIQFSDLNKTSVKFMRQILLAIIMNEDLQASLEVFHRISKPPKLHMFRESLRLFIQHFLVKNAGKKNEILGDKDMAVLRDRAVEVDRILTMHETKLRL